MARFLAKHSPLVILAVLCAVLAFLVPDFAKAGNLQSVAYRTAVVVSRPRWNWTSPVARMCRP
ncbi:MAG TPA: hypothetical protein PLO62_14385, partial [Candidatus Hydrogenedentes bacterium]|nr:hypothetical protein [Candidatus Hydrogenedentota bacterium]